uniref:Uncharacterized protein n=1 Tax=Micrurus corallinus TaxID=54390 RepID=A0A2D4GKU8_MICCO
MILPQLTFVLQTCKGHKCEDWLQSHFFITATTGCCMRRMRTTCIFMKLFLYAAPDFDLTRRPRALCCIDESEISKTSKKRSSPLWSIKCAHIVGASSVRFQSARSVKWKVTSNSV